MGDSVAEFLERLNGFDVSSSEIVALLNDQPRYAEEQFGRLTLTKISFQPVGGVPPKQQTAVLLRLMALLNTSGLGPPSNKGWSDGAAFRAAARLPLQLFEDGGVGFDASSFAAELARFPES
jgi:hypothetical protein